MFIVLMGLINSMLLAAMYSEVLKGDNSLARYLAT